MLDGKWAVRRMAQPMAKHGSSFSSSSATSIKEKRAVSTVSSPASRVFRLSLPNDGFVAELKQNPAYQGLDIGREIG
jgi:hypothetical protein